MYKYLASRFDCEPTSALGQRHPGSGVWLTSFRSPFGRSACGSIAAKHNALHVRTPHWPLQRPGSPRRRRVPLGDGQPILSLSSRHREDLSATSRCGAWDAQHFAALQVSTTFFVSPTVRASARLTFKTPWPSPRDHLSPVGPGEVSDMHTRLEKDKMLLNLRSHIATPRFVAKI